MHASSKSQSSTRLNILGSSLALCAFLSRVLETKLWWSLLRCCVLEGLNAFGDINEKESARSHSTALTEIDLISKVETDATDKQALQNQSSLAGSQSPSAGHHSPADHSRHPGLQFSPEWSHQQRCPGVWLQVPAEPSNIVSEEMLLLTEKISLRPEEACCRGPYRSALARCLNECKREQTAHLMNLISHITTQR